MFSIKSTLFIGLCGLSQVFAQDFNPKYANEFLNMGVGAAALGMGSAVVADAAGMQAGYWNPAGLVYQEQATEIGLMHASYFGGLAAFDHLGVAHRYNPETVLALNVVRLGVDNIYNTTQLIDNQGNIDYSQLQTFNSADYAIIGSIGKRTRIEHLSVGVSAKVLYRHIGNFAKAYGFGFDAGLQYRPSKYWSAGLSLRDATSTFSAWTYNLSPEMQATLLETNNAFPLNGIEQMLPRIVLGIAGKLPLKNEKYELGGQLNAEITTDGPRNTLLAGNVFSLDPKAGLYLNYDRKLILRTGVSQFQYFLDFDQNKKLGLQPHLGAGVVLQNWTIDYAFTRLGLGGEGYFTHLFSLKWAFGGPQSLGAN
jgi:hypothetical protein